MSNLFANMAASAQQFPAEALKRSFFTARNPTPGTGIASDDTSTARSATAALMTVFNSAEVGGEANVIIPVRLWLRATTVNTSGAELYLAIYTDVINRRSSGGSAITEVAHEASAENGWVAPTSKATIHFGDITAPAASSEVKIWTREVLTTIGAADDTYDLWFGDAPANFAPVAAATGHHEVSVHVVPPVWIGPGATMLVQNWASSQSADNDFEFEFWYVEQPHQN